MRNNRKAQSMIEYATMTTLVLVGILFMGPYVIRSINAFFQSMEEEVEDSLTEEIVPGPSENFGLPGCACSYSSVGGVCADPACETAACGPRQMCKPRSCLPGGCYEAVLAPKGVTLPAKRCEYDMGCCTAWAPSGLCGAAAAPPAGHTPGGCPVGQCEFSNECGGNAAGGIVSYACL